MAKQTRRRSKARTTAWCTVILFGICALPWLLPSCSFETNPDKQHDIWGQLHPDDNDGGE